MLVNCPPALALSELCVARPGREHHNSSNERVLKYNETQYKLPRQLILRRVCGVLLSEHTDEEIAEICGSTVSTYTSHILVKRTGGAYTSPRISFAQSTACGHQPKP
ncbi:hypothetical protein CY34DRAFT_804666 [Suillus luteus UH-Slu-Lm8-n1]|uniref:Uncharacterized protein n=1 Tax=Suillus luteus UH-Slu-Lm8-n1 TaxID=930992 RepID=A0A0D0ALD0_9AGAM|nr:hypothetical protein CY34DRAFT_804666 [Suillus luteus UH-Slu-Lm8-n1]